MRIWRHCCATPNKKLSKELLNQAEIILKTARKKYSYDPPDYWLVFDIFEDDPLFPQLHFLLGENSFTMTEVQYDINEISASSWLYLFSRCNKFYVSNEETAFVWPSCYAKENLQIGCIGLTTSKLNWGSNFFMSTADQRIQYLVKDATRVMLEKHELKGMKFRRVYKRKSKDYLEDCWQLCMPTAMKCTDSSCLTLDEDSECEDCCRQCYVMHSRKKLLLHENAIPKNVDVFMTGKITADDKGYTHNFPIISQKFYQTLVEEGMTKNLTFSPVDLT